MSQALHVLLVDDEADSLMPALAQHLEPLGVRLSKESRASKALDAVARHKPDAVLLDLHFPGDDDRELRHRTTGGRLLAALQERFPNLPVLVFTTRLDDAEIPAEEFTVRPSARIAKPDFGAGSDWAPALASALRQAIESSDIDSGRFPPGWDAVLGSSPAMRGVAQQALAASRTNLSLVLLGERGTGRRTVAHAIHHLGGRTGLFLLLDCVAGDDERLRDGTSSAGDLTAGLGVLDQAAGGTVCVLGVEHLTEPRLAHLIGQLWRARSPADEGAPAYPGSIPRICVCVEEGAFQAHGSGLMQRLIETAGEIRIRIPPLRERLSDLPELYAAFVTRANPRAGKHVLALLRPETLAALQGHPWPGNLKELENCILNAVAQTSSNVLLPEDLRLGSAPGTVARGTDGGPVDPVLVAPSAEEIDGADGVQALTDELERLRRELRYAHLNKRVKGPLRAAVLTEFVRRLRARLGQRVTHKVLAEELCGDRLMDKDYNRVRKAVTEHINLSEFDWNQ